MFHSSVNRHVLAAADELGHKIRRPPRGFTQRHALSRRSRAKGDETEKIAWYSCDCYSLHFRVLLNSDSISSTVGRLLFKFFGSDSTSFFCHFAMPMGLFKSCNACSTALRAYSSPHRGPLLVRRRSARRGRILFCSLNPGPRSFSRRLPWAVFFSPVLGLQFVSLVEEQFPFRNPVRVAQEVRQWQFLRRARDAKSVSEKAWKERNHARRRS